MTSLASGAVTTTESVWEGGRLALERVTDSTGVSTYAFVYGPGSLPLELIVTTAQGTTSYAYLCDRAGSVVALTDSNGAVVATYRYDPWGAPTGPARIRHRCAQPASVPRLLLRRRDRPLPPPSPLLGPGRRAVPEPGPGSSECGRSALPQPLCVLRGDPVNASDPTGAIMDTDGDGRTDSEDTISESYVHTPSDSPLKAIRRAKMNVAIYAAHGTPQQLIGAQADLYDLTGWPGFEEFASGSQVPMGDGTPFGRNNREMWPSRPDNTTWMLVGVSALTDGITPFFGPFWPIPAAVGSAVDLCYSELYYKPRRERGEAPYGDVLVTRWSAVPFLGSTISACTFIGYDFIPWAEPNY
ncbi:MAG: hypothetical protein WBJ62_07475 [Coriobacteriia bacterium]